MATVTKVIRSGKRALTDGLEEPDALCAKKSWIRDDGTDPSISAYRSGYQTVRRGRRLRVWVLSTPEKSRERLRRGMYQGAE